MDVYKKLKLEFEGIKNVILDYTNQSHISNFLNGLEEGLKNDDREKILYFLNEICIWYADNIPMIYDNQWVFNCDEHQRSKTLLDEVNDALQDYDFSSLEKSYEKKSAGSPRILLSHRSSDKKYADALEKLIIGLGIKNDELIYTSHPLHKIPLGENIYEYLRKNIHGNLFVIILWSDDYLESAACLNEMGAAWVVQKDYINIYTPNFSFGNPKYHECAVDTRKMGAVLNPDLHCRASMAELKDKLSDIFALNVDENTWMYLIEQFIEEIR